MSAAVKYGNGSTNLYFHSMHSFIWWSLLTEESAALVTCSLSLCLFHFIYLFFRSSHASWLPPWLQGLCRKFGQQWKQNRVREVIWLLWSSPQCLGGQEPSRLCLRRIWRPQRCKWCSAGAWWKVGSNVNMIFEGLGNMSHLATATMVYDCCFTGHCVVAGCE